LVESSGDESEESESEEEDHEEKEQWAWREQINRWNDIDFNEVVDLSADEKLRSLTSSKGFYDLFFTDQAWKWLVTQTNLYANQKSGAAEKSLWYPVSLEEMKGWVAVYLCMGSHISFPTGVLTPSCPPHSLVPLSQEQDFFRLSTTFTLLITPWILRLIDQILTNYTKSSLCWI